MWYFFGFQCVKLPRKRQKKKLVCCGLKNEFHFENHDFGKTKCHRRVKFNRCCSDASEKVLKMVDRIKYEWYYSQADRWIRHDLTEDNMILERFPK